MTMRFIGLGQGVSCMRDLGFVYLDNGSSTLRLSSRSFDELLAAGADSDRSAPAVTHPGFFTWYSHRQEALDSAAAAAWPPGEVEAR